MFYKSILWFLSKTFLIYLFPNFLAKGKFEILDNRYRKFHANYYNYKNRKKSPITDLRVKNAISLVYQNNLKNVIFKKIQKNNYIIDLIK